MPQHVLVTEYNDMWPKQFVEEADYIYNILGDLCVAVHHIGSTSVPGLMSKPIIDIMPVVKNICSVDTFAEEFEKLGYEYLGEFGIPGRRYLRKGGDERTHQVHIFEESNKHDIKRHLAVRDYLRTHPKVAYEYGRLKYKLAEKFPYDIEKYCDGKNLYMKTLEKAAISWSISSDDLFL